MHAMAHAPPPRMSNIATLSYNSEVSLSRTSLAAIVHDLSQYDGKAIVKEDVIEAYMSTCELMRLLGLLRGVFLYGLLDIRPLQLVKTKASPLHQIESLYYGR